MELSRRSILRTPVILLALLNLTILGIRLWPWQNVMSLPGNGTTGVDPAITLLAYVGLGFWIGSARQAESRKALFSAALLGMVAGLFLVAQVVSLRVGSLRIRRRDPAGCNWGSWCVVQRFWESLGCAPPKPALPSASAPYARSGLQWWPA